MVVVTKTNIWSGTKKFTNTRNITTTTPAATTTSASTTTATTTTAGASSSTSSSAPTTPTTTATTTTTRMSAAKSGPSPKSLPAVKKKVKKKAKTVYVDTTGLVDATTKYGHLPQPPPCPKRRPQIKKVEVVDLTMEDQ